MDEFIQGQLGPLTLDSGVTHTSINLHIQKQPPRDVLGKRCSEKCSNFTEDYPCQSAISIKLLCKFIEIALRYGCFPVNLLHFFITPFPKNTSEGLLLIIQTFLWTLDVKRLRTFSAPRPQLQPLVLVLQLLLPKCELEKNDAFLMKIFFLIFLCKLGLANYCFPWTKDVSLMCIRRSENDLNFFCMSFVLPIWPICPQCTLSLSPKSITHLFLMHPSCTP